MIKSIILGAAMLGAGALGTVALYEVATPGAHIELSVQGTELHTGTFVTPDPTHPAAGTFQIVSDGNGGRVIQTNADFSIVNAPDPHFRVNGKVIAKIVNVKGINEYPIPNFIGDIESVHAWCEIADVNLGTGVLDD